MSFGWPIHSVITRKDFWKKYFWQPDTDYPPGGYKELVNHEEPLSAEQAAQLQRYNIQRTKWQYCRLGVPLGEHLFRLQFDPQISNLTLALRDPSGKVFELGFDDEAHWHPHVLRCEELDWICRSIARQDVSLPHPGIPLLLLFRFAPLTDSEDSEQAIAARWEAWNSLGLFDEEQIQKFLVIADFRGTGVLWRRNMQQRWVLDLDREEHPGVGLYTFRCEENPDFPFDQLDAAIAAAKQIAGGA